MKRLLNKKWARVLALTLLAGADPGSPRLCRR